MWGMIFMIVVISSLVLVLYISRPGLTSDDTVQTRLKLAVTFYESDKFKGIKSLDEQSGETLYKYLLNVAESNLYAPTMEKCLLLEKAVERLLIDDSVESSMALIKCFNLFRLYEYTGDERYKMKDAHKNLMYIYVNKMTKESNVISVKLQWTLNEMLSNKTIPGKEDDVFKRYNLINDNGLAEDYSWLSSRRPSFEQLIEMYNSLELYSILYGGDVGKTESFRESIDKFYHPANDRHLPKFVDKLHNVSGMFGSIGRLGLEIFRTTGIFVYKTSNSYFAVRVQNGLESYDGKSDLEWPLWINSRNVFHIDDGTLPVQEHVGVFSYESGEIKSRETKIESPHSFIYHSDDRKVVYWYQSIDMKKFLNLQKSFLVMELGEYDGTTCTIVYSIKNRSQRVIKMRYRNTSPRIKSALFSSMDISVIDDTFVKIPHCADAMKFTIVQSVNSDAIQSDNIDIRQEENKRVAYICNQPVQMLRDGKSKTFSYSNKLISSYANRYMEHEKRAYVSLGSNSSIFI